MSKQHAAPVDTFERALAARLKTADFRDTAGGARWAFAWCMARVPLPELFAVIGDGAEIPPALGDWLEGVARAHGYASLAAAVQNVPPAGGEGIQNGR